MVLVPGSGFIGNVLVALCLLVVAVLLGRSFWRTARQPDPERRGRDRHDDEPPD
jgi:hypothetical protein